MRDIKCKYSMMLSRRVKGPRDTGKFKKNDDSYTRGMLLTIQVNSVVSSTGSKLL